MNFTEVVNEVLDITQRPDLANSIRREVNAAINFCCIEANFARDFDEGSYPIDPDDYIQSIALSTFPRWRKFRYIRPDNRNCFLTSIAPENVFTKHRQAQDVFYVQGDSVVINSSVKAPNLLVGYFRYPPVLTDVSPTFWLLEVSPYMIIDKAAAKIFKNIGNNTEAALHEAEFRVAFTSAMRDYKYGVDYG